MQATQILMDEHVVIDRVLTALQAAAVRLERGENVRAGFFVDAALFIKNFADGCHHRKEEGVLFVAMIAAGMPAQGGPIGVMLVEHDQGRTFTRAMKESALELEAGDLSARAAVVSNALGYVTLLRQHIQKENNILFLMADKVIPPEKQEQVLQDFEKVEHEETGAGVHEKYLELAEALEKESRDPS